MSKVWESVFVILYLMGFFLVEGGRDGECGVELYNYSIYLKNLNIFLKS